MTIIIIIILLIVALYTLNNIANFLQKIYQIVLQNADKEDFDKYPAFNYQSLLYTKQEYTEASKQYREKANERSEHPENKDYKTLNKDKSEASKKMPSRLLCSDRTEEQGHTFIP